MVGMLGLEPRNPEGADLQSAAVAAVPHPHSVFKHHMGRTPCSGVNNTTREKSCQRIPRYRAYLPHESRTTWKNPQVEMAVKNWLKDPFGTFGDQAGVCGRRLGPWLPARRVVFRAAWRGPGPANGFGRRRMPPAERFLEPVEGVEPTTHGLQNRCSAIEPYRR